MGKMRTSSLKHNRNHEESGRNGRHLKYTIEKHFTEVEKTSFRAVAQQTTKTQSLVTQMSQLNFSRHPQEDGESE